MTNGFVIPGEEDEDEDVEQHVAPPHTGSGLAGRFEPLAYHPRVV